MIDVKIEKLIPLSQVCDLIPSGQAGKKLGRATIYRWMDSGRLDFTKIGGTRYTSIEAITRFSQPCESFKPPVPTARLPRTHDESLDTVIADVMARLKPPVRSDS